MIRHELQDLTRKVKEKQQQYKHRICVCCGASCISSGSEEVLNKLKEEIKARHLEDTVEVIPTGCMGPCNQGPLVKYLPEQTIYQKVNCENISQVVQSQLVDKKPLEDLLLFSDSRETPFVNATEDPFFKRQQKIALRNCGDINPESIEDYLAAGGYEALDKSLFILSPEEVIAEVKQSRIRGRGGAGYPTGLKWETVYKYISDQKYVICNGDEGDPGAFMDRSVLEGNPHRILESMAIAGYAIGASKGFAYIRGEYPLAIKRFELAIKQATKLGLLGKNILGSPFSFEVEVRIGAGAFVCGEETALIASIEGKRGTPKPRPPFPAESGLWGKPTLINNVETYAAIPAIIMNGGEWYGETGTPKSAGTKVFALAGKINYSGLIEVPMGTTLREVVFDIGGGIQNGEEFKAAQTGGPSGGCIPAAHLDVKMDYESLVSLGSIMGSGGLIVMDKSSDMVDVARYFMEFCMDESCGKCIPCRVGTKMMHDLLQKIVDGKATRIDLDRLEELAVYVKETSLCGLGASAPNPLLSTLRHFREEYESKIVNVE
ncbi:MAG TPA: NADH-ubiquinone oxidoreductase-F iron-sulfur binding region domain-containing protein [Chitinophagaceae bacterium]|nr:NADH-ubiquinone oxidoreductase-F iron-sulfur binding region domain-containing protein [Chitinophagaceae bacterium]HPH30545.1 NADH-ubiquinone oxidoreductase-F iron-sulfur binding region domain-containing protein [Chitinophagaceae bacterium]HPN58670.1 NADH-ubiquinone oxidoreductase-F iron-sulfur binding region domain-containing protein [Chitinophagaceae bacterium]